MASGEIAVRRPGLTFVSIFLASVPRMIACAPHSLWKEAHAFERRRQKLFKKISAADPPALPGERE